MTTFTVVTPKQRIVDGERFDGPDSAAAARAWAAARAPDPFSPIVLLVVDPMGGRNRFRIEKRGNAFVAIRSFRR